MSNNELADMLLELEELDLSHNQLTKLPPAIGQLRNLRVLNLSGTC